MKIKLLLAVALVAVLSVVGLGLTGRPSGANAADLAPVSVNVNSQQGIWVNGVGTVTVTPDIAILNLGVSVQSPTVADAQSKAAAAMDKVIAALTSNGVDKKDIQTQYYNIQQISTSRKGVTMPATPAPNASSSAGSTGAAGVPAIAPVPSPDQTEIIEFQVSNTVTVTIRNISKVGTIIDAVATAGGDYTRVNGVSFSVDKPEQYNTQARESAMKDAKAKADQLAKLAGVTLGKATYISENSSTPVRYAPAYAKDASGMGVTTPITPGEMDISLNVQVAYAIQ
jgi:uncharacterized protein